MASLAEVRKLAVPSTFPAFVLEGTSSAACFFSAAFLGRNAEVFVADAGVKRVVVVDIDKDKLAEMASIYPDGWEFRTGDAYQLARAMVAAGEKYDLITVDPWITHSERMLDDIAVWLALTDRYAVLLAHIDWFNARASRPIPSTVERWLKEKHVGSVLVREVRRRTGYKGGVYWIVLEKAGRFDIARARANTLRRKIVGRLRRTLRARRG